MSTILFVPPNRCAKAEAITIQSNSGMRSLHAVATGGHRQQFGRLKSHAKYNPTMRGFECMLNQILTRGFECTLNRILTRGFECTLNRILSAVDIGIAVLVLVVV